MKILFTHDHKFCKDKDGLYYSDGQYPYRLWQRYLTVFDEIVVAARVRPLAAEEDRKKLDLSSGPGVSFCDISSLSSLAGKIFARRQVEGQLADALAECDGLIARISEISRLSGRIAEKMGKPWLAEVVYCPFDALWNHGSWQGKLYAFYAYYATKRMVAQAPFSLYVTSEFLQKRYPTKRRSVSCSDVDLNCNDPQVLVKRLNFIADKTKNRPVRIGLIGALANKIKGVHIALEALRLIKDQIVPFEFYILGGGDQGYWRQLAASKGLSAETVFCGTLPHGDAVQQWLDKIDLYIQPSFQEGLPRALLEAMSRGCPAIASSAGGIPELLAPECIHKPGDSRRLATLIKQAVNDTEWQAKQAEQNFKTASQYDQQILDQKRTEFWRLFLDQWRRS